MGREHRDEPAADRSRLWHPFADMAAVQDREFVIDRAEDCHVWDSDGRRYLDATASLWCVNLGHGRPELAAAIAEQHARLDSFSIFGDYANEPAIRLAAKLAERAPVDDPRVFLTSGGGDSIDTAAKIVRGSFARRGQPARMHLISRLGGYHGTHGYGTSLCGIEANTAGWGPLDLQTSVVEHDSVEALEREILRLGPEKVAGFFCEPVIGAGGVHLPPEGYLEGVAAVCAEYGVLLVADAVICGFGRLGTWFGVERWDVRPDLITFAKGVNSGVIPLGGVVVSGEVAEPFFAEPGGPMLRHGQTYAGHPLACAAGLAAIDCYERDGMLERGRTLEAPFADALAPLRDHPAVGEVRAGIGLMAAVDLSADVLAENPGAAAALQLAAREEGLLVRPFARGVAMSPPLTITLDDIRGIGDLLGAALDRVQHPARAAVSGGAR
jgi:adenosylmethionine-8-amino-7-oxononanoate aminotransferase